MKCFEAVQLLSDHLDGSLTTTDEQQLQLHLEDCKNCQRELYELRHFDGQLQNMISGVAAGRKKGISNEQEHAAIETRRLPGVMLCESLGVPWPFAAVIAAVTIFLVLSQLLG